MFIKCLFAQNWQNLSDMEVRTFVRLQRVIWDDLLAEVIQKQALF